MQKKKFPVVSVIFYVVAGILLAYSIWAASYSINYISTAVEQNQLVVEGLEFEIVSFYMTNVAQYVVFAILMFGIGWILQKIEKIKVADLDLEDDELIVEEWLEEDEEQDEVPEENSEEEEAL
jgi:hypothetical protein